MKKKTQSLPLTLALLTYAAILINRVHSINSPPPFSCDRTYPSTKSFPFCNAKLPIQQRASDLVSRLTLDEKISQLVNTASAIPRLGIPSYEWWSEALHGVASGGFGIRFNGSIKSATSFPQVILTAATFDSQLWFRIGQVVGTEARAVYNAGEARGMTFWAPNINIFRDPRWGRGQETPGEDPLMTSKYVVSYVRGLQGDGFNGGMLKNGHLKASACCKHFTAYDLDSWDNITRYVFDAKVSAQDMADTYQPPFQSCVVQGKASGIMCAYNRVNGVPNCADYNLLSTTARSKWGFYGYIVSDCDAVSIIHDAQAEPGRLCAQGYAKTPEDAVADVLKAGMDVNCGSYLKLHTKSAVEQRKVSVTQIDRALQNLFSIRIRLGLFNGNPINQPYGKIGPDQVCTQEHQTLALDAARNGIVLLKNNVKLLPLPKPITSAISLAIIGPNANSAYTLLGNYAGPPCKSIEILKAMGSYVKNIKYHPGCDSVACGSASILQSVEMAKAVDYVVMVMGLDQTQEKEEHDRVDLTLPGKQTSLITAVAHASKKPIVLVILSGGPVDISFAKYNEKIGSILWAGYPGEAGGIALAEIIFGDHNPGGRLPVTWYPQSYVKIPMTDMRMRPQASSGYPGRTYRFYKGNTVFNFGYGLSYSSYAYKFISVSQSNLYFNGSSKTTTNSIQVAELGTEICKTNQFSVKVAVTNNGEMSGKHPVLLFMRRASNANNDDGSPLKQLVGFESVTVNTGERSEVEYLLNPCEHFSKANEEGLMVIEQGSHLLVVGDREYPMSIVF